MQDTHFLAPIIQVILQKQNRVRHMLIGGIAEKVS